MKATKQALITPYLAAGSVTVKKMRSLLALSATAASEWLASAYDSAVVRRRTACGYILKDNEITMPMGP